MKQLRLFITLVALFGSVGQLSARTVNPIHVMAAKGKYKEVKQMLERGVAPSLPDPDGNTPLHFALLAKVNHIRLTKLLLDSDPALANAQNKQGISPLHVSVVTGKGFVTNELLKRGANPNLPDNNGITPVHLATAISYYKNKSVLKDALHTATGERSKARKKAIRTGAGITGVSVGLGGVLALNLIATGTAMSTVTYSAATVGAAVVIWTGGIAAAIGAGIVGTLVVVDIFVRNKILLMLLDHGGNPNILDYADNTPLHILADGKLLSPGNRRGGRIMASILLEKGADPTLRNKAGLRPYDLAKQNKRLLLRPVINPGNVARKQESKKKFKELF